MTTQQAIVASVIIVSAVGAWMMRYDLESAGEARAFQMDRWTGEVVFLYGPRRFPVTEKSN